MGEEKQKLEVYRLLNGIRKLFDRETPQVSHPAVNEVEFNSIREEYNETLKSLQQKLALERAALERLRKETTPANFYLDGTTLPADMDTIDQSRKELRYEIEELHKKLKSGVEVPTLATLRDFMLSSAEEIKRGNDGDIEHRIRAAGLVAILERSADIAWRKLEGLMGEAGHDWPEPHDLFPNASDEDRQRAREREISDLRDSSLSSKPEALGELIIGEVKAWKLSYPSKGSWLWQQVALCGVFAGIEAKIAMKVVNALLAQADSIREEAGELLKKELESLSKATVAGGKSIQEMDHLVQGAGVLITEIIVKKMLTHAESIFREAVD